MIKNILKSVCAVLSILGFLLVVVNAFLTYPVENAYKTVLSMGVGYPPSAVLLKPNGISEKHLDIDLPKSPDAPIAIGIYDSIFEQNETLPPQDQPSEPPVLQPFIPENALPVIEIDMSEMQSADNLIYRNESKYSPDINSLAASDYPLKYSQSASTGTDFQPLVLIIHTHGTECYLPEGAAYYTPDTPTRSYDTEQNVIAVGKTLADTLNQNGIDTLHCETMFDKESYSKSYDLSEQAVLQYLDQYPSIQYIFDVHRDSIINEKGEKLKPVTYINGVPTAQAMLVVGTDSAGAPHPNWINNLTVAAIFQTNLIQKYGSLMRPINLRASSFNAEHATGSILIEIGTCGNTLSEAKSCASALGETIAELIKNDGKI